MVDATRCNLCRPCLNGGGFQPSHHPLEGAWRLQFVLPALKYVFHAPYQPVNGPVDERSNPLGKGRIIGGKCCFGARVRHAEDVAAAEPAAARSKKAKSASAKKAAATRKKKSTKKKTAKKKASKKRSK